MSLPVFRRLPWQALPVVGWLLVAGAARAQQPLYALITSAQPDSSAQATAASQAVAFQWTAASCETKPVPVALSELTVSRPDFDSPGVVLYWTTTAERQNAGFEIERRAEGETTFHRVAMVPGQGTSYDTHRYAFVDEGNRTPNPTYYRLRQLDAKRGLSTYTPEQKVPGLPAGYPRPEPE